MFANATTDSFIAGDIEVHCEQPRRSENRDGNPTTPMRFKHREAFNP